MRVNIIQETKTRLFREDLCSIIRLFYCTLLLYDFSLCINYEGSKGRNVSTQNTSSHTYIHIFIDHFTSSIKTCQTYDMCQFWLGQTYFFLFLLGAQDITSFCCKHPQLLNLHIHTYSLIFICSQAMLVTTCSGIRSVTLSAEDLAGT